MAKVYGNAVILEGEELEVTRGYLVVEDGRIKEIGEGNPGKGYINLKRGIVCPSFTNAHTHIGDACAQDYKPYLSIEKRVGPEGAKFEILRREEKVREGIRYSLGEMEAQGTGAFSDFREGGAKGARILREELEGCRLKGVILGRPNGDEIARVLEQVQGIGISSLEGMPEGHVRKWRREAEKRGKIFALHAGEVKDDLEEALGLKPDFVVHLTNAGRKNLEKVFSSQAKVVLCPRANASFADGLPPVKEVMEGTTTALGTDNVMANSLSMLREAEFAFKVARAQSRDYTFSAKEVLRAATMNGRKVLNLPSNVLEEENRASFVVFRNHNYLYDPILGIIHRLEKGDLLKFIMEE